MRITTAQLAELVAFKGRTADADEATLCGFERAVVEIVFVAQTEAADLLRAKGYVEAAEIIEDIAATAHRTGAERTRGKLYAELARSPGREVAPHWPPPGSTVAAALRRRQR